MSREAIDMTGIKAGRLTVVARAESRNGRVMWLCRCDCGTEVVRSGGTLRQFGGSCGCGRRIAHTTHGASKSKLYGVWTAMHQRCSNPNNKLFHRYGGRGIKVCRRWGDFTKFRDDMGDPNGLTLDRIDNDGPYSPSNCRWATQSRNARNRSSARMLTHRGKTMCVTDWAEATGISKRTILGRLGRGWGVKRALTQPA